MPPQRQKHISQNVGTVTTPLEAGGSAAAARRTGDQGEETLANVTLANNGSVPAIETKLTVMNADGAQVLPAYFSDNYVTLMPGETRVIEIRYPTAKADKPMVNVRGWNVTATATDLRP